MTQNERVKEVRKTLGLTLEKFGDRLGIKKAAVSKIEKGENSLTDANIKAICREFSVDYMWLTTGEGEMFVETDDDFFERIDRKNMIKMLLYASDDDIEAFDRLVDYYISLRAENKKD